MSFRARVALPVLLVLAPVTSVAAATASAASGPSGSVVVWGDSLAVESRPYLAFFGRLGGLDRVETHAWGGTAPCDWRTDVTRTLAAAPPRLAILSFVGNASTPCMRAGGTPTSAGILDQYRSDLRTLLDAFAKARVPVLLVGQAPSVADPTFAARRDWMYHQLAAERPGVRYVDAGAAVAGPGRTWTAELACLTFEGADRGCRRGRIPVRAPDRGHFCPAPDPSDPFGCPVWSSGAMRFSARILDGAREIVGPR